MKEAVQRCTVAEDEKVVGFIVHHNPKIVGMTIKIAKQVNQAVRIANEYDEKLKELQYESTRNIARFDPIKLVVGEDVEPTFRKTKVVGVGKGVDDLKYKTKTFPDNYDDENSSFNSIPILRKVRYDTGSHIRCLAFQMTNGRKSDQIGGHSLKKEANFEGKDVGKIECFRLKNEEYIGRMIFYDR